MGRPARGVSPGGAGLGQQGGLGLMMAAVGVFLGGQNIVVGGDQRAEFGGRYPTAVGPEQDGEGRRIRAVGGERRATVEAAGKRQGDGHDGQGNATAEHGTPPDS